MTAAWTAPRDHCRSYQAGVEAIAGKHPSRGEASLMIVEHEIGRQQPEPLEVRERGIVGVGDPAPLTRSTWRMPVDPRIHLTEDV